MAASTILIQLKRGLDAARRALTPSAGEVLVNSDTDHFGGFATVGDGSTVAGRYPGAGNAQPGWVTSSWYYTPLNLLAPSTSAVSANIIYYMPICVPPDGALQYKNIGVNVLGAGGGSDTARLGIYSSVDGKPAALVVDSGTLSVSSTGLKAPAASNRPLRPGWYWLAFTTNGSSATYSALNVTGYGPLIGFVSTGTIHPALWYEIRAYAALPATATPAGPANGSSPLVCIQAGT